MFLLTEFTTLLQELPRDKWFCCLDCNKIFSALQNLISSGPEIIPAPLSAAIHQKHAALGLSEESNNEIQWRILNGKSRFPEHLLLLSRAAAIFRVRSFLELLEVSYAFVMFAVEVV